MEANRKARYCRCGTRLARDNKSERCAPCQAKAREFAIQPPESPDDFWDTDQFRDAFRAQHIGHVSRAYRKHPKHIAFYGKDGVPQSVVGGWLGLTQAQISRIENGPPVRHLDSLTHWVRTLRIPEHLLWFRLPSASSASDDSRMVVTKVAAVPRQAVPAPALLQPPSFGLPEGGGNGYSSAMQSFRAADRQVGGGHLYATVVQYLQAEVAPRMFGVDQSSDGRLAFTAAAALTEMAGWMAHDAGRDQTAERHFERSLELVKLGDDRQLGVHILASLSHLAHHRGKPTDALQYARRGLETLSRGPRSPELEARLLAMQARAFAALRQPDDCAQHLIKAERVLEAEPAEERSPWVSHFDEGSLANEAARCLLQIGDLGQAKRQAERVVQLRPGDRTRSRAFGQLILVTVLVARGRPEEACAVAQEVLDATQQLGSYLVIQQLLDLRRLLEPHRGTRVVAEFLSCLDEALRERALLYQWLAQDGRSGTTALGRNREL
ncbi:DNA-binding protein [Solwaraspora sp. WMMD791]|uniref:tetratricopeptide repeat protein n=1 Tax=Solwaraspora sp. WMMD791 TaxID=3016086 RepID=UPI00249A9820|nr:DNA-binding protein [Solwaraspora sp. WMMD791]WFE25736.1 DNA-binding protein [Solwaraspora sp. WMMD791]